MPASLNRDAGFGMIWGYVQKGDSTIVSRRKGWMVTCMMLVCAMLLLASGQAALAEAYYQDGKYQIPFQVLKDTSDEISATAEYVDGTAEISIENGKIQAQLTLKNSSCWKEFQVETAAGQAYSDVTTVSEDTDKQLRVVTFPIDDLTRVINAKVHIIVTGIPGFEYDHHYDIRLRFDTGGIPEAKPLAPPADTSGDGANEPSVTSPVEPAPDTSAPAVKDGPTRQDELAAGQGSSAQQPEVSEPQKQQEQTAPDENAAVSEGEANAASPASEEEENEGAAGESVDEEEDAGAAEDGLADDGETASTSGQEEQARESSSGSSWVIYLVVGLLLVIGAGAGIAVYLRRSRRTS